MCLRESLVITKPSEINLKSATVYWNYNNIDNDMENFITVDGARVSLEHGYWNFDNIKEELSENGVDIFEEVPTGTCTVSVDNLTNFEEFGSLLGFDPSTEIPAGSTKSPTSMVNINRGLRRLDIQCSIVDKANNIDIDGQYSDVLASIPIPTDKALKGTLSHYNDINSKVKVNRGTYNSLKFKVFGNVDRYVDDVFLELYIEALK